MASHHLDVASSHLYFSFATQREEELPPQAVGHGTTRGSEKKKKKTLRFPVKTRLPRQGTDQGSFRGSLEKIGKFLILPTGKGSS